MRNYETSADQTPPARTRLTASDVLAMLEKLRKDTEGGSRHAVGDLVPVFRDGRFSGFTERVTAAVPGGGTAQDDAELQRQLTEAVSVQGWLDPDHVNVAVEKRVVRLSGCGDSTHAVLALRRIAASAPSVAAIIDELWVECE